MIARARIDIALLPENPSSRFDDDDDPYAESIDPRVTCSDCAAACCRLTVVLQPDDNVAAWLTERTGHGLLVMAHDADGYCVALAADHQRCTIYDSRPDTCRRFAMGGPYCRDERARQAADYGLRPDMTGTCQTA